jgi:hypothetical protein
VLTEAQVRAARREIDEHLSFWAERLGLTGGLKVHTVEPDMHLVDFRRRLESPQYRFIGYLLGEPADDQESNSQLELALEEYGQFTGAKEYKHLTVGKLRSKRGSLLVQALGWPAVMLFGPDQWPSYRANTAGWPLYRALGGWRTLLADEGQAPQRRPARPVPGRPALDRQNRQKAAGI